MTLSITGCSSGLSGTYVHEGGEGAIKFTDSGECTLYQGDGFLKGTYEKTADGYQLEIKGDGFYLSTVYEAIMDGKDLILTGGLVSQERFIKE